MAPELLANIAHGDGYAALGGVNKRASWTKERGTTSGDIGVIAIGVGGGNTAVARLESRPAIGQDRTAAG